jgi:hypothetical protein
MWRFIVCYRYLVLACLTMAVAVVVEYQLGRPAPPTRLLSEEFRKIDVGMTGEEIRRILGPPTHRERITTEAWLLTWEDGREKVSLAIYGSPDNPIVIAKGYRDTANDPSPK